jgi:hypothetical protein
MRGARRRERIAWQRRARRGAGEGLDAVAAGIVFLGGGANVVLAAGE